MRGRPRLHTLYLHGENADSSNLNREGYEDTSYTAKIQARYTDLIVFNKWEYVDERRYDDCLDRVGDLDLQVANVKSDHGIVDMNLVLGLDSMLAKEISLRDRSDVQEVHEHTAGHQGEVEVLSVTLSSIGKNVSAVNLESLEAFLLSAPKDEIYRIKAIISASRPPASSGGDADAAMVRQGQTSADYLLNWAFGRWTFTPVGTASPSYVNSSTVQVQELETQIPILRMTIILARDEARKWKNRIESGGLIESETQSDEGLLQVKQII